MPETIKIFVSDVGRMPAEAIRHHTPTYGETASRSALRAFYSQGNFLLTAAHSQYPRRNQNDSDLVVW